MKKTAAESTIDLYQIVIWGLYSCVYIAYVALVASLFVFGSWKAGVFAIFFIAAAHPLRHLWENAVGAGYDLEQSEEAEQALALQKTISRFFEVGVYSTNVALIVVTLLAFWGSWKGLIACIVVAGALVLVEFLHLKIRQNRRTLRGWEAKKWEEQAKKKADEAVGEQFQEVDDEIELAKLTPEKSDG